MMQVTVFKHFSEIDKPVFVSIQSVIDGIKDGRIKDKIEEIRSGQNEDTIRKLKMKLPCVLFSGRFDIEITKQREDGSFYRSFRNDNSLSVHSRLVPFDIDDVEDIPFFKSELMKDEFIYAVWTSPSGTGLHGLIKIADGNKHESHYAALLKRYPRFDPTARNPSRVLFFSYDPDLLINEDSKTFFEILEDDIKIGHEMSTCSTDYKKLDIAAKMIRMSETGARHNSVMKASYLVGGYIAGGIVEESIAREVLRHEVYNRFDGKDVDIEYRAIDDGLKAGQYMPINELAKYQQEAMEEAGIIEEELSFLSNNKTDEDFIRRYKSGLIPMGLPFGYDFMDKYLLLKEGEFYALLGHSHVGKAQPLSSKILTPSGWVKMADVKVGDDIVGSDGKSQNIISVHPQGERDVYKVGISDGSFVYCDKEHLWSVNRYNRRHDGTRDKDGINRYTPDMSFETMKLSDMIGKEKLKGQRKNGLNNFLLPSLSPVQFTPKEHEISPYILGVILGDGHICNRLKSDTTTITTGDDEILSLIKQDRFYVSEQRIGNHYSIRMSYKINHVLNELGLMGTLSHTKFIPDSYKYDSVENRIELLSGLMDTDGYVNRFGSMSYCTVSEKLRDDVIEIVNSLGGRCLVKKKNAGYKKNGVRIRCKDAYDINIKLPPDIIPMKLSRKIERLTNKREPVRKYIQSIEFSHREECQCIVVSNSNSLYVTDNYILTHNSSIGFWLAFLSALKYDWGWVIYTGENRVATVKMKLIEFYCGARIREISEQDFKQAMIWVNDRFFFVNNDNMHHYTELLKFAESVSKYHSIKGMLIDPVNALKTAGNSKYDYEMEMYTDMLLFTKRANIALVLSIHTNTKAQRERTKDGNQIMPFPADADGGSVLYNKADVFITTNRNIQDPNTWMITEMHINKMRNKETGGDVTQKGMPIQLRMGHGIEFTDEFGCLPFERNYLKEEFKIDYKPITNEEALDGMLDVPF